MAEEEDEINESDIAPSSKIDLLSDDVADNEEDIEVSDRDDSMNFSFDGSRGFDE